MKDKCNNLQILVKQCPKALNLKLSKLLCTPSKICTQGEREINKSDKNKIPQ
jgi:hypothetical protein